MTARADTTAPLAVRAVDHVAITVPDLEQALDFFLRVLGARLQYRNAAPAGAIPDMVQRFHAPADAAYRLAKIDLAGMPMELFEYRGSGIDHHHTRRNCDAGGGHIGLLVDDIAAAMARLRAEPGVQVLAGPATLPAGHALAGRQWVYFLTPWGQQMELVTPPFTSPSSSSF